MKTAARPPQRPPVALIALFVAAAIAFGLLVARVRRPVPPITAEAPAGARPLSGPVEGDVPPPAGP